MEWGKAEPKLPIDGDKLFQVRARAALPLLVRQAVLAEPIYYSDLAAELGMPNPRNLDYVLGAIGKTLKKRWLGRAVHDFPIPPLQGLVINRHQKVPGTEFGSFIREEARNYRDMPLVERRAVIEAVHGQIFAYPYWADVLQRLGIQQIAAVDEAKLQAAVRFSGGEGLDHRRLKCFVANNPGLLNLSIEKGLIEQPLPSGDRLDVEFSNARVWVAAEVKPASSPDADLIRGLFQCVKYRAVMAAADAVVGRRRAIRTVLVLESTLPPTLISLKNALGIELLENVKPR